MATPLRTHTHEWNTQTHSGKRRRILTALIVLLAVGGLIAGGWVIWRMRGRAA